VRDEDELEEVEDDEEDDRFRRGRTPDGRAYLHHRCGGQTLVSGGDYTHICDPFWPCTGTYCCGCSRIVPLSEVEWIDTGEPISEYRSRLAAETPALLKVWRYGVGFVLGGVIGTIFGLLIGLLAQVRQRELTGFGIGGALIGAFVIYFVGTLILNRVYDIDYRRMK
jgi:hypothetical protein